ncbi:MAG: GatB/YqeY domain-containing protein [Candidatus Omnitrophica bacterium]|nr:GatB/YqeY domain-containing protein [Candidatus Omnitrophota bacterium]
MRLEEKILKDYQKAMKQRDTLRSSILSFLRSSLMNFAIEKSKEKLDDGDVITVIKRHIKRSQDSIEQFKAGGREELVEKETKELNILKSYLPVQLKTEEINKIIDKTMAEIGASSIKEMGKVMKEVMSKLAGKASGKQVSELVKLRLSLGHKDNKTEK